MTCSRARRVLPASVAAVYFLAASSLAAGLVPALQAQQPAAPARTPHACTVDRAQPTDAENLLSAADTSAEFAAAEAAFRAALGKSSSESDHLGLVMALNAQGKLPEAQAEADAMLAAHPGSALAETAASYAAFRAAKVELAYTHALAAGHADPCEARAAVALANVLSLNGYFGKAAALFNNAHQLRPHDEIILREWLETLPRAQALPAMEQYLAGPNHLSANAKQDLIRTSSYDKVHRPGECHVSTATPTVKLPIVPIIESFSGGDANHPTGYGLDVVLNGSRRRMQIDTGASGIVLTPAAAKGLNLEPELHFTSGGVGDEGSVDSYLAHVQRISIGGVTLENCTVEVLEKAHNMETDGLIGADVFRNFLVTLDFPQNQVRLAPLPPLPHPVEADDDTPRDRYIAPEMKDYAQVLRLGHLILLPSFVGKGKTPHYLAMDTGADQTTLSPAMAREGGKLAKAGAEFRGISGKVNQVYLSADFSLTVADIQIPSTTFFTFDTVRSRYFEISGLFGISTLSRLRTDIDYRDNLLRFTYDWQKDKTLGH